jgi:P4 family phage/plasmid primase-like protien
MFERKNNNSNNTNIDINNEIKNDNNIFFTLPQGKLISDYFYEDNHITKFADNYFRGAIKVNKDILKKFGKDFMLFKDGRWKQISEDSLLSLIKRAVIQKSKKLNYTDTQFKRIVDVINSSIDDFPSLDEIFTIQTTAAYKIISEHNIYLIDLDNSSNQLNLNISTNKGQFYNFVSLPPFNIDNNIVNDISNIDNYKTNNTIIDTFLKEIALNDINMIKNLQEIAGYSMLFGHLEPYIYIGVGKGSNGKSVFASMLKYLLGVGNVSSLEYSDINPQTAGTMERNFLNLPTELSGTKMLPENLLKAISDGESIMANEKYKEPRNINPIAKQFALTNELPAIKDASDGFWRRAVVIPFDLKITKSQKSKRDKNYFNVLFKDNVELIRKWAFTGLLRLIKNKGIHTKSDRIMEASKKYQLDNNNVLMFIEEFIETKIIPIFNEDKIYSKMIKSISFYNSCINYNINGNGENSISLKDLYYLYKSWATENGYKPLSIKNYRKKIEEKQETNTFNFSFEIRKSAGEYKLFLEENDLINMYKQSQINKNRELDNINTSNIDTNKTDTPKPKIFFPGLDV